MILRESVCFVCVQEILQVSLYPFSLQWHIETDMTYWNCWSVAEK